MQFRFFFFAVIFSGFVLHPGAPSFASPSFHSWDVSSLSSQSQSRLASEPQASAASSSGGTTKQKNVTAAPSSKPPATQTEKTEPPSQAPTMTLQVPDRGLDFDSVTVGSTSPVQVVTVTIEEASDSSAKISATAVGDFVVTPPTCELKGIGKCAFGVTFVPKTAGETRSALTIALSSQTTTSQTTVILTGKALPCGNCSEDEKTKAFTGSWWRLVGAMLFVVLLYLAGIILIRWHLIARPTRRLVQAAIEAVRTRLATLKATMGDAPAPAISPLETLVAKASQLVEDEGFFAMLPDYILWNRGQELSAWNCLHEVEEQMVLAYVKGTSYEALTTAELWQAELNLRQANSAVATGMADRIKSLLDPQGPPPSLPPSPPSFDDLKSLLSEGLGILYDRTDTNFAALISWQNKTVWLIGAALLLIVSLGATLQHEVFFLVGAAGGLLSRLSRSLNRADVPTDYGASWTTLFLSPVVGALAGWCGVLLLILASQLNVVGEALKVDWCNPYCAVALGAALLLGTSERAFDSVLNQLEDKVKAQQAAVAKPSQQTSDDKKS